MTDAPDIWAFIKYALDEPSLKRAARDRLAPLVAGLFHHDDHRTTVRASDAGRCRLELWAYLHDACDIPEDRVGELTRMDIGSLYGAWCAALFATAYEDAHPAARVLCEMEVSFADVPGHVDALIVNGSPQHLTEIKSTYFAGGKEPMKPVDVRAPYQVDQALIYAEAIPVPRFSLFTIAPASWTKDERGLPVRHYQDDFVTAEYAGRAMREVQRLREAEGPERPVADPRESWRCESCRYSRCPKNRNPLADVALAASLNVPAEQAEVML